MSINDVPEMHEKFAGFELRQVSTNHTIGTKAGSRGQRAELLVGNFCMTENNVEGRTDPGQPAKGCSH